MAAQRGLSPVLFNREEDGECGGGGEHSSSAVNWPERDEKPTGYVESPATIPAATVDKVGLKISVVE